MYPSLERSDTFAAVMRLSTLTPDCSIKRSGFCTSIFVFNVNDNSRPSGEMDKELGTIGLLEIALPDVATGFSRSRRMAIRFAIVDGSPISGNVVKLPVASTPYSASSTRAGKLST